MKNTKEIQDSWELFIDKFSVDVLPLYAAHEDDFDFFGIHGRRHLTRSLIFSEVLGRFYYLLGETDLDFYGIRRAVSFHDSGREGNGKDYWETESAQNCFAYLVKEGKDETYAKKISETILNKKDSISNRLNQIVYDVDVLEFMRLFADQKDGFKKFRNSELYFLGENELHKNISSSLLNLQDEFLQEFWRFIEYTEKAEFTLSNAEFLPIYLNVFQDKKDVYPLMNSCFDFESVIDKYLLC